MKMTKEEFLRLMQFPREWADWKMYPDEIYRIQVGGYARGHEEGSEHDRNGAFHWWLRRNLTKPQLERLISLTYLDPDEGMASDVRRHISKLAGDDKKLQRILKQRGGQRRHGIQLFGYERGKTEEGQLLRLSEASVVVDAKEARALGEFFLRCAQGISSEPKWEHEHFNGGGIGDIIVVKKNKSKRPGKGVKR